MIQIQYLFLGLHNIYIIFVKIRKCLLPIFIIRHNTVHASALLSIRLTVYSIIIAFNLNIICYEVIPVKTLDIDMYL